jgi:hypothetical protein
LPAAAPGYHRSMFDQVRVEAAAVVEWSDLVDELDCWAAAGRVAELWWRDDDAIAPTPQLDRLLRLAAEIPVALAVIPALARPDLADAFASTQRVAVLQHGWQHADRAGRGKKSEYPEGRPAAVVGAEIGAGRARLKTMFGPRALPVLVPPWNRLAGEFLPLLPGLGITAVSAMASRHPTALPPGLAAIDVHVDLVDWHGARGFVGKSAALGGLIDHLRARRLNETAGPIGMLTHHLVLDRPTAAFLERLTGIGRSHAAIRWAAIDELMQ